MDAAKMNFIEHEFVPLVSNLFADAPGKWGKMNAQQMVEHVIGFFKVSSNKLQLPLITPEEHLPKYMEFLRSDKAFRENTQAPLEIIGEEALPLRYSNMNEAIGGLQKSIEEFVAYFAADENKKTLHPVFGNLNFEEWVLLHYKHLQHHGRQFGVV